MDYDFTIYGSGISAKIITIALARNNFKVCLISDHDIAKPITTSNLVTFLSYGSINYLKTILDDPKIFDRFLEIRQITCLLEDTIASKDASISFNERKKEILGKIINNTYLDSCLNKELSHYKNIKFIENDPIISFKNQFEHVCFELKYQKKFSSKIFIMSSSNNKKINDQLNFQYVKKDLKQEALSIHVMGNFEDQNCAYQKFTTDGPIALLPFTKSEASIVWSLINGSEFLDLNKDQLEKEINKRLNVFTNKLEIKNIEKHRLKFSFAKKLFSKKTILIGNIAHNIHPVAGQGLNLSIKDIALYLKLLTKYEGLGYEINNEQILDEFNQERKLDNTVYSFGTLTLENLLSSDNKILNYFTRLGVNLIQKNKFIKNNLTKSATGKNFFKRL